MGISPEGLTTMQTFETWCVYLGIREGKFSVNSRTQPGLKYQAQHGVPFPILDDDMWLSSMSGFTLLYPVRFFPKVIRMDIQDLTYLSKAESSLIEGLASSCPDPARVVELGTGKGLSTSRLLYGLSLHEDAKVWTFDLDECQTARDYIEASQVPNWRYEFVIGDTVEKAAELTEELDLLYIDASHTYEGVKADIIAWTPKLKVGGFIALHDYGNPLHAVTPAIDELLFNDAEHWTFRARADSMVAFERCNA